MAAMASSPHAFVPSASVGRELAGGTDDSALLDLMVAGETAVLATAGDDGAALFTSARLLVTEQVGIMSKRFAVKCFRRDAINAFAIDADGKVTLTLYGGSFGYATLVFADGFDPMRLSAWLGETLVRPQIQGS